MELTFRWYGSKEENIKLSDVKQIPGAKGIVGMIMDIPVGEVWPEDRVKSLREEIEAAGLSLKVIESVNIHDDIKIGKSTRDAYIENYKTTIRNLANQGVEVICYNFMPVFDWLKTDLAYELPDGSNTMAFFKDKILDSPEELIAAVENSSGGFSLPGWEPERLVKVKDLFTEYEGVTEEKLRENFKYFMEAIIPTCEEVGIKMAIHPDDPPFSIFGLPRIVKNAEDLEWIVNSVDSPSNGITFCTGSIGTDPKNNIYEMIADYTKRDRIPFAHIRNIKFLSDVDYYEAAHPSEEGSFDMYKVMKAFHDNGFTGYARPDHGRMIWGEKGRPGYGLYDRALGIAYLKGLWEALEKSEK
ncbi:mannonate dehydratase [Marinilactibacillus psychrotolerans]|uniref:Mannonate dehydratase n=1 Tax=Marinilactibacillus psychrotolerans TaxID=191770 RepID=A0A5R9C8F9_9LACT|nr:mannonate dehydratase [Marinilactibacillus psychrotolerans]TLQ09596.1 mannonate dehydratase [Marinilactibacillus psychrotolerans]